MRDIKAVEELDSVKEGLYYVYEEDDITKGYGLILGLPDTPYEHGFYLVSFQFPDTYPYSPPLCKHLAFCDRRQSPNFHDNGTICLTRLNTWESVRDGYADKWTPIMNILSVLRMIQTQVLTADPLNNEPPYDYKETRPLEHSNYTEVVRYCNFRYNIIDIYYKLHHNMTILSPYLSQTLCRIVKKHLKLNGLKILESALVMVNKMPVPVYVTCMVYNNSRTCVMYDSIYSQLLTLIRDCGCYIPPHILTPPPKEKIPIRLKTLKVEDLQLCNDRS